MYLNKVFIIGNLTRDPELKAIPSGIKVCSFSVATNRVWKDKNGARQEAADAARTRGLAGYEDLTGQWQELAPRQFVKQKRSKICNRGIILGFMGFR